MIYRERLSKFLGLGTRYYCPYCDQIYRVWGAKRAVKYLCQTCPAELWEDKK